MSVSYIILRERGTRLQQMFLLPQQRSLIMLLYKKQTQDECCKNHLPFTITLWSTSFLVTSNYQGPPRYSRGLCTVKCFCLIPVGDASTIEDIYEFKELLLRLSLTPAWRKDAYKWFTPRGNVTKVTKHSSINSRVWNHGNIQHKIWSIRQDIHVFQSLS